MNPYDKEILRLKKALPKNNALRILDRYKMLHGKPNYEAALDAMAYKAGVSFGIQEIYNMKGKRMGHVPRITYYHKDQWQTKNLVADISPYKSRDECIYKLTKEVIYWLGNIANLEELVFGEA